MESMPTFTTAAAYAADARARATDAGAPIRRTDFRSLMLAPSDFIFLSRGDVMIADRRSAPRPLEAEDLEEFIDYENVKGIDPLTWLPRRAPWRAPTAGSGPCGRRPAR